MFELCRIASILGFNGPFVAQELGVMGASVDHGLNGEDHPCFDEVSGVFECLVVDIRFLMEGNPDPVSGVFSDDAVAVPFGMAGDFVSDIAESVPGINLLHPDFEADPSHLDEIGSFFGDLADREHPGCIAEISVDDRCNVNVDNISLLENHAFFRYPMTDGIIERDTGVSRIIMVSDTGGLATVCKDIGVAELIELLCRDARFDIGCNHIERGSCELRRLPDPRNLFRVFDDDFWFFTHDYRENRNIFLTNIFSSRFFPKEFFRFFVLARALLGIPHLLRGRIRGYGGRNG